MDKAREYSNKRCNELGMLDAEMLRVEIEKAYNAGYFQGHADANRKETIAPQQDKFDRGLN